MTPTDPLPCEGHTALFFAINGDHDTGAKRHREAQAKQLCATCPARLPCRDLGRAGREHGIWGGETEAERAAAGYLPNNHPHPHGTTQTDDLEATG